MDDSIRMNDCDEEWVVIIFFSSWVFRWILLLPRSHRRLHRLRTLRRLRHIIPHHNHLIIIIRLNYR